MPIVDTSILKESRDRYLTYALSVVSGRALPDVRDGLKPVQRRILYAMYRNLNLKPASSHRKSAAIVGAVLASYHPHGDTACYEAMVRMAQDFSLRYPLVDGQGNFGSLDGDNAAAYRYTEARLTPIAIDVIGEIDEETVAFRDNFDGTTEEPTVLPSRVPNLLVNGATGIAVGMATSIPPHNLKDVVKALLELSDDPEISNARLVTALRGPDFPTGCSILNSKKELDDIYKTGRGTIRMRGTWEMEDLERGKKAIVITSIPYTVNKAQLVEKIANLIIEKKVPQLSDIRDESTDDIRVVLELSSGADPEIAMAYLFKHTALDTNFSVNLTLLVPAGESSSRPELVSLKECLQQFLVFRQKVVTKKLQFERKNLLERIHILEGFVAIFDALDEALKIIRKSEGRSDAAQKLRGRFKLSEIQSFAIVDMRIYQLSRTNIDEIREELKEKERRVKDIDKILGNKKSIIDIVKKELEIIGEKYGDKRRSAIIKDEEEIDIGFNEADYVIEEEVYAIVTADGWIKRIRQNNELTSTRLREGDRILRAHPLSTRDTAVFLTNMGTVFSLKVSDFPSSSGYGDPIQKILKFKDGEKIIECFGIKAGERDAMELLLLTQTGMGFISKVDGLVGLKRSGKRVMNLKGEDKVVSVSMPQKEFTMFTRDGSGLTISGDEIPAREGAAVGVILMGVRDDDTIVAGIAHDGKKGFRAQLSNGKSRDIPIGEVTKGRRALKGTKVVSRAEILSVEVIG